jgi:hypothetical protein
MASLRVGTNYESPTAEVAELKTYDNIEITLANGNTVTIHAYDDSNAVTVLTNVKGQQEVGVIRPILGNSFNILFVPRVD